MIYIQRHTFHFTHCLLNTFRDFLPLLACASWSVYTRIVVHMIRTNTQVEFLAEVRRLTILVLESPSRRTVVFRKHCFTNDDVTFGKEHFKGRHFPWSQKPRGDLAVHVSRAVISEHGEELTGRMPWLKKKKMKKKMSRFNFFADIQAFTNAIHRSLNRWLR